MSDDTDNSGDGANHLNVVHLKTDNQKRNEVVILKLEELLAQAKQGQYIGMVFVGIQPNPPNNMLTFHWSQQDQEIILLGGIEVLKNILLRGIRMG